MVGASALCGLVGDDHVREGREGDAVDGVMPALVVAPGSVDEVSAVLAAARRAGWGVAPRGAGTKLRLGNPPERIDLGLDLSRLDRVLEHAAGDLVLSVEAGARLATIQAAIGDAGQRLALDPLEAGGTVGGIIAANASGPRRYRYGTVRDLLIGITVVLADGTIAKAGGKVVKNVAGYDLGKLMTGSLGTLAVIVGATFRLHPRPQRAAIVRVHPVDAAGVQGAVAELGRSTLVPNAIQLAWTPEREPLLGLLFEGNEASVDGQASDAVKLLADFADTSVMRVAPAMPGGSAVAPALDAWQRLVRQPPRPNEVAIRITCLRDRLGETIAFARARAAAAGLPPDIRGAVGSGVLELRLADADAATVATLVRELRAGRPAAHVIVTAAPPSIKAEVDVWGPVGDSLPLMRRVKEQFDPDRILNPGRFVGGI